MLQRVQSVFLLLASAAMLVASAAPLATFLFNGDRVVFEAMGIYLNGNPQRFHVGTLRSGCN